MAYQLSSLSGGGVGQVVTLLLGMNDAAVSVLTGDAADAVFYGVVQSSSRTLVETNSAEVQQAVSVMCTDGTARTVNVDNKLNFPAGKLVEISVDGDGESVQSISPRSTSGTVSADGTALATGNNQFGQCDLSGWTNLIAVACGETHTVGLRSDGTVLATGRDAKAQVGKWENITAVDAGMDHTLGLCQDGTVVAAGQGMFGTCAVEHWQDVTAIAAGHMHSLGLRKDGRLLQADGFIAPGVLDWTDLTAVAVGPYHTVAVKQDGTVVASGDIQHGQCQVEMWTNVRTVAAGERHTVALCADGRVLAVGDDSAGQCDVTEWKLWGE